MRYELCLNAKNGRYSDRIGTFNSFKELKEKTLEVADRYDFDPEKDFLTVVEVEGEERLFEVEVDEEGGVRFYDDSHAMYVEEGE